MTPISLTEENINTHGGLPLIGRLIDKFCAFVGKDTPAGSASRSDRISDSDILKTEVGLLSQGLPHFEDVEEFRNAEGEAFESDLGLDKIPSQATLRQRLEDLAKNPETLAQLQSDNLNIIKNHQISGIEIEGTTYIPLDIDVSPFDNSGSNRENLGRTYKGFDGFAPIFAYIGNEGWLINHELRPGTQHSQKETPEFLRQTLALVDELELDAPVLIRMDAGNDSADTLKVLRESDHYFIVKRNQRKEDPVQWLGNAVALGEAETPREGKEVYTGTLEHLRPGGESSDQDPLSVVYQVTLRSIDKLGQELLIHETEVDTYWHNTWVSPKAVIENGYHDHGTSEQFHSELKSDMNLERFPANNFATNTLFLLLGSVSYNLLRAVEQRALAKRDIWPPHLKKRTAKLKRRRIGTTIRNLICVAGKWVKHAARRVTKISRGWPWSAVIVEIDADLRLA